MYTLYSVVMNYYQNWHMCYLTTTFLFLLDDFILFLSYLTKCHIDQVDKKVLIN
jgi:hypothetical protein